MGIIVMGDRVNAIANLLRERTKRAMGISQVELKQLLPWELS
jgi:hypothetical protein